MVRSAAGGTGRLWQCSLESAGGQRASLLIAPECGVTEETCELLGDGFCIQIDVRCCALRIHEAGQVALEWAAPADAESCWTGGAYGETKALLTAIRSGSGFAPSLEDALAVMLTAEAVAAGGHVDIPAQEPSRP